VITIDTMRPRARCYVADRCWKQDTGDPADRECPAGTCELWDEDEPEVERTEALTVPKDGEEVIQ
jgi:hypothetical protein